MVDDLKIKTCEDETYWIGKRWWYSVEADLRRLESPPIITWEEMKGKLQEKYISLHQHGKSCDQFVKCGHGSTFFEQYMLRPFDTGSRIAKDHDQYAVELNLI